jgi:hypothetical protein
MKRTLLLLLLLPELIYAQTIDYKVDALVYTKEQPRTITVGGSSSDIQGYNDESLQIAVDALPPEGGTVKLAPGVFEMKAPVRLRSNTRFIGSGRETILKRIDGYHSRFIVDADYGELKITVEDPSGFGTGMSFQITDSENSGCWNVTTGIITDIVGNTLYIDTHLVRDYDCENNGMVTNAGSCVSVRDADNIFISNLTIDGNKSKNDRLDGCNGGGISIMRAKGVTIEDVHIRECNGEGITWQITENVTVRNCEISGCSNMGLHPGTGSPNTLIEGNDCHDNNVGLFLCWRVHHSIVRNNKFHNNLDAGISTGHKDSDVTFVNNHIYENGVYGVYLRDEDSKNSPHRNTFVGNIIENNGTVSGGYGFSINGNATDLVIENNIIRDNKNGNQKAAIIISKNAPPFKETDNTMSGHKLGNVIHEK